MSIENHLMYVGGTWIEAEGGRRIGSFDPATGDVWTHIPDASEADVNRAVEAAFTAFRSGPWPAMSASDRGRLLARLAELIRGNAEELAELETRDTGKLIRETRGSTGYIPAFYEFYGGLADKIAGATLPMDKPDLHVYTLREPVGVVAAVVPWNSPLMLTTVKLAPALAAGNTVVIKPSEHASAPILHLARLIEEAGFPPGVVNVVTGMGEPAGRVLTAHPDVNRIAFTGGSDTARHVVRNSAENFAHVSLELGGKSPQIVFEDANLESAVNGIVAGIFGASGQSCVAGSRLYVQDVVYDRVVDSVIDRGQRIVIGDPMDATSEMGPLATEAQLERFTQYVGYTEADGGKLLSGGGRPAQLNRGWFVEPTVIECPRAGMRVSEDEIFGPVLSVMRFSNEDEVIEQANASRYGLASGVWTRDIGRMHRLTKALHSGIVWVNMYRAASPIAPFGGYGDSGQARESGADAIYDYTRTKTVWVNTSDVPMADPFKVQ